MAFSSLPNYRFAFAPIFFLLFFCFFIFFPKRTTDLSLSLYQDLSSQSPFTVSLPPPSPIPQPQISLLDSGSENSSDVEPFTNPSALKTEVSNAQVEDQVSVNVVKGSVSDGEATEPQISFLDSRSENSSDVEPLTNPSALKTEVADARIEDQVSVNVEKGSVSDGEAAEPQISFMDSGSENSSDVEPLTNPSAEETEVSNEQIDDGADVSMEGLKQCDLYMGTWVKDEEHYPVYKVGSCPYVDEAYDCGNNGRADSEYAKWRWKPYGCDLPRFNATDFLVRLRGKRLMLVGDSMNRNQFESILCLLREGLQDKKRMFETHGYKITKGRGYFVFKFKDYDCTVEFVRSHFLVREGVRINAQGNSNPTLSIDRIDKTSGRWKRADILVFNTGHWWTHGKTARGKNYYKEGNVLYPQFDAVEAYRRALKTWGNWIDHNINPAKQLVFYRGYSSAHFRGGDWDSGGSCNGETEPVLSGAILDNYPLKMKIVQETIEQMKVPVILLNVTRLTNFRKDAHPSIYGKNNTAARKVSKRRQDCSHWCLPGVPDAWNELIYAALVSRTKKSKSI